MNRIQAHASVSADDISLQERFQCDGSVSTQSEPCVSHATFAPLHYEPNYSYPLLIWLHGEGENELHMKRVMPKISMRNYVAVAPRGTCEVPSGNSADDLRFTWRQTSDHIYLAQQRIMLAIDQVVTRLNVNRDRIFLLGAGCGGTMAFRVAMAYPDRFRGVLSLGGSFPQGNAPMGRILEARQLPLFVASSRDSDVYPQHLVCQNLRLFHTAGLHVTMRQYPGADDVSDIVLSDVDRWIMEVIAGDHQTTVVTE